MSLNYAEKLAWRDDLGGQLGAKEHFDAPDVLEAKLDELQAMVLEAKKVIVFTGAGISTACGIPDFRGPQGVWTAQQAGKPLPKAHVSFAAAKPSLTHQALVALVRAGEVTHIVSQNVDGLHLRSGIPRQQLAELHGNVFAERCQRCRHETHRDFEVETIGFKPTGRRCGQAGCRGMLHDRVLDWEDELPEDELAASERESSAADLALCLGTSLQISPACNLPLRTVKAGGRLVVVNLQKTPKDRRAALLVRARADAVMAGLMRRLRLPIPAYCRTDCVVVSCGVMSNRKRGRAEAEGAGEAEVCLAVAGRDGDPQLPQPMLESEPAGLEPAVLRGPPWRVQRRLALPCRLAVALQLRMADAADPGRRALRLEEAFELPAEAGQQRRHCFVTQEVEFGSPAGNGAQAGSGAQLLDAEGALKAEKAA